MTTGAPLAAFTDFIATTGPAILTGPEDIINEAAKNTYALRRLIEGKSLEEQVQGGESIKDTIFFDVASRAVHYQPNPEFSYSSDDVLTNWSIPWRFTFNYMVWNKHTIGLNVGELSKKARHHKFKTLKRSLYMNMWTDEMNFFENDLWRKPSNADMEATSGKVPYSLAVSINEFANGVPPGFTTIQNISPTTEPKWRNQVRTYAEHPANQTGWDAWTAMSQLWYKLRFDRLPKMSQYSEPTTVPNFIACSLLGISLYEDAMRRNQDSFVTVGRQDPAYNQPQFRGIGLDYISNLDHAEVYRDGAGTGFAGETDASTAEDGSALGNPEFEGPRYWFINGKYYAFVVHQENYFDMTPPITPSKQPFTRVMGVDCWHNLACRSRIRQGLISPSADIAAT